LEAGDLIAQGDKFLGQILEAPVIFHVLSHLRRLFPRDALGKLFAVEKTLEDVIGSLRSVGSGRQGFKKLFAQGTATQAVDGLHLQEEGLSFLQEIIKIGFHGAYCIYVDTTCNNKMPSLLGFLFWVTQRSHTHRHAGPGQSAGVPGH
jgi:hypothetical protein